MWTVDVSKKRISEGDLLVTLVYSDGTNTIAETLRTHLAQSATWLAEQAARRVEQLTALYAYADSLQVGPLDYSIKSEPTPDEVAKAVFSEKLQTLKKLESLAATGVDVAKNIAQVKADIANDYRASPDLIEVV